MKKTTLLLMAIFCTFLMNAQTVIFNETFGEDGPSSGTRPKITDYAGWDNGDPITFSYTTTDYADVRSTGSMNTHVWFPANKETDLVISNIATADYSDLKLSFEIACNSASGNVDKVLLYCNDVVLTVSSATFTKANEYVNTGEIDIPNAATTKLRFLYTVANNPTNYGYRLDNVKITGTPSGSGFTNPSNESPKFLVSGNELIVKNMVIGTNVEFFNALGAKVQTSVFDGNAIEMNNLSKGVYIIRAGKYTQKIMF